jgi:hypothetical protein
MDLTDAAAKLASRISDGLQWDCDRRSADPVGRVARVQRPTIESDIRTKTARLDEPLRAVVTVLAQAHERAEPEFIYVASVRLNMVADLGRGYDAALQAEAAKRMREQLLPPDPRPASRGVPLVPSRRLATNTH